MWGDDNGGSNGWCDTCDKVDKGLQQHVRTCDSTFAFRRSLKRVLIGTALVAIGVLSGSVLGRYQGREQGRTEQAIDATLIRKFNLRHYGTPERPEGPRSAVAAEHYSEQFDAFVKGYVPENALYNNRDFLLQLVKDGQSERSELEQRLK